MIKKKQILIALCLMSAPTWGHIIHIVKKSETLSGIANKYFGKPIYGTSGTLQKIKALNPDIRNEDFIYPKQKINITAQNIKTEIMEDPPLPPEEFKKQEPFPYSRFKFASEIYYSSLRGEISQFNADINLISKINYGALLTWEQNWSQKIRSRLFFGIRQESYYEAKNKNIFENHSLTLAKFGLGISRAITQTLEFHSTLSYASDPRFRLNENKTAIILEQVHLPKLTLGLGKSLFQRGNYEVKLSVSGIVSPPLHSGEYRLGIGQGYESSLMLMEHFKENNQMLECGFFYSSFKQPVNNSNQDTREVGLRCGISVERLRKLL